MHNFTTIKKGLLLSALFATISYMGYAQEVDSTQYSTDTTSVTVQERNKGPKVTGKITDGNSKALLNGVSISITGYSATISNEKGEFSISVPDYVSTVQVTLPGYHQKLIPVVKGKPLTIVLYPENFPSLYVSADFPSGAKSLSRTVGAIAVHANQAWNANSETPISNIQGRLPGVNAIRKSGTPGIGADLFIRGFNSLYASNKPLYVVDGMIYDAGRYGSSLTSGFVNNPLQHIDVRDIVSVSVLKDAVQSAEYGTRAANGVVVIETSRAKDLATKIDFAAYGGVNSAPNKFPLMNGSDFLSYITDIYVSQGKTAAEINAMPFMTTTPIVPYTQWQDQVFRTSYDQNYYMQITGGDNVAKYSLSLGLLNDKGITDKTDYLRYNTRFNADLNLSNKLSGNVHLGFTYGLQNLKDQGISPLTNPIFLSLVKSPVFNPNAIDENGNVSPTLDDADTLGISNPRALIENGTNSNKNYRFSGSTNFEYRFSKVLKASTLFGITYDKAQGSVFVPRIGVADTIVSSFDVRQNRLGSAVGRYYGIATDARLNYNNTFNHLHSLNLTVGFRYNHNESEQDLVTGFNSGTDQLISIGNSNVLSRLYNGNIGKWRTLNNYLTAEYSFADKYLLNAAIALDGSSRFGNKISNSPTIGGNKFAVLPAIGAAWIVSSESFMNNSNNIDLIKLRASYGLVGNDDVGNYTSRQTFTSENLLGLQGLVRSNIANPYIQWEVVKKFNAGIDASFLKERLSFSFDYWNNETSKMVTEQGVKEAAVITGIDSYLSNNAAMRTRGFDLGANVRILNGRVKWDAGVNLGSYKNRVTELVAGEPIYTTNSSGVTYITSVGNGANQFYGYRATGVYSTVAEASTAGLSIRTSTGALIPFAAGDMRFTDLNNDKIIDSEDRQIIGNPNPDVYGSFNNSFSFKRLRVDALMTFVSGNDIYNYNRAQLESGSNYYNQTNALLNRWKTEGQKTGIPKATFGDPMGNSRFSDRWIEDGSYLRLRTLAVSYNFPFTAKALKYVNVYATANNVFTLSKYKGYDPEFSASESIFSQGIDSTLEPQVRSFQLGIRVGL